jgi:hypothetical protein
MSAAVHASDYDNDVAGNTIVERVGKSLQEDSLRIAVNDTRCMRIRLDRFQRAVNRAKKQATESSAALLVPIDRSVDIRGRSGPDQQFHLA